MSHAENMANRNQTPCDDFSLARKPRRMRIVAAYGITS